MPGLTGGGQGVALSTTVLRARDAQSLEAVGVWSGSCPERAVGTAHPINAVDFLGGMWCFTAEFGGFGESETGKRRLILWGERILMRHNEPSGPIVG